MKTMFLIFVLTLTAMAENKKIIDLGEMEIDGELRRPSLQWLDSSKRSQQMLTELYKSIFSQLETDLTQPLKRIDYEKMKKRMELVDVGS